MQITNDIWEDIMFLLCIFLFVLHPQCCDCLEKSTHEFRPNVCIEHSPYIGTYNGQVTERIILPKHVFSNFSCLSVSYNYLLLDNISRFTSLHYLVMYKASSK